MKHNFPVEIFAISVFALALALLLVARKHYDDLEQEAVSRCAIIHEPKSGCPKGFSREPKPRFTERDGSKEFACIAGDDMGKEMCIDVLKSGEEIDLGIFFVRPAEQPKERPRT